MTDAAKPNISCAYHPDRQWDGSSTDALGEHVFKRPMPLCAECARSFEDEPFDYEDWKHSAWKPRTLSFAAFGHEILPRSLDGAEKRGRGARPDGARS